MDIPDVFPIFALVNNIKLYKIIDKIDNQELKAIVELRAIKGLTWEQIGEAVHLERTTVAKKYANFINDKE